MDGCEQRGCSGIYEQVSFFRDVRWPGLVQTLFQYRPARITRGPSDVSAGREDSEAERGRNQLRGEQFLLDRYSDCRSRSSLFFNAGKLPSDQ